MAQHVLALLLSLVSLPSSRASEGSSRLENIEEVDVRVQRVSVSPAVFLIEGFLDATMCDAISAAAQPRLSDDSVDDGDQRRSARFSRSDLRDINALATASRRLRSLTRDILADQNELPDERSFLKVYPAETDYAEVPEVVRYGAGGYRRAHNEAFERDFYLRDDDGFGGDDGGATVFMGDDKKFAAREEEMAKQRKFGGAKKQKGMSAMRSQLNVDQQRWEESLLLKSGVATMNEQDLEVDDEEETRVQILVHQLKPPFLSGKVNFSAQQEMVSTVKDPTSDMANCARNGSALLMQARENREKSKMRTRYWELGGSKMGNAMGVKDEESAEDKKGREEAEQEDEDGNVNYKDSAGFAKHMKAQKNEAKSGELGQSLQRLDEIILSSKDDLHPRLRHFLENRSYAKALIWLEGETPEKGVCGG